MFKNHSPDNIVFTINGSIFSVQQSKDGSTNESIMVISDH